MDVHELNELLKTIINDIVEEWGSVSGIRHKVSKILLGAHGQASINRWMSGERETPFGIKPLTKIGNLLDYDVHLAFVKRKRDKEYIHDLNIEFAKEFKSKINEYLKYETSEKEKPKKNILSTYQGNSVVNRVLEDILGISVIDDELRTKATDIPNLDERDIYLSELDDDTEKIVNNPGTRSEIL